MKFPNPNYDVLLNQHCASISYTIRCHGRHAFLAGRNVNQCQYPEDSAERALWEKGWRAEFFDNMDVVMALLP